MIPSLFLAHGSPMLAIQDNEYSEFLARLGKQIKPDAIVIFTAHWESDVLTLSSTDSTYDSIYDFYGFPEELYAIQYPAKGSTRIAAELAERFAQNGIPVRLDSSRGLDHGSWTLLYRLFPQADIPVVQLSIHPFLPAEQQYKIGQSLRGLGRQNILVIGSGVTVHNLRMIKWGQTAPEPWAVAFDDWLIEQLQKQDLDALFHYAEKAPEAQLAVPRPDHFVPLFIAMGSGDPAAKPKVIHRSYELGTLSYLSLQF